MRNIGDVLLMTPLFANLREHFPQARISALVNSGTESMLTGNPSIDQVFVYDRTSKSAPLFLRLKKEAELLARLRRERFDLVLNMTDGDRGALAALVSGARVRIGMDAAGRGLIGKNLIFSALVPRPEPALHTVDVDLRMLEAIGLPALHKRVSFHFSDQDADSARSRLKAAGLEPGRYFLAHCTSRWMFKTMPPAIAARLLDLLSERSGMRFLLTSSPEQKELDYLNELKRHCRSREIPHFSDQSLKELGALISMARFFAGVDSAPMHMAAALDVPVLGVFGPSSARTWGPWNNQLGVNSYTAERGVQFNGKHVVLQSARECVPCHRDGCNGSKKSDCLDFQPEQLEAIVTEFLKRIDQCAN